MEKNFARFLLDNGLVFEINRKVLHPLGLALVVDVDPSARKKVIISGLMTTDDEDGFVFDEETFLNGQEKLQTYMDRVGNSKLESRKNILGYIVQEDAG